MIVKSLPPNSIMYGRTINNISKIAELDEQIVASLATVTAKNNQQDGDISQLYFSVGEIETDITTITNDLSTANNNIASVQNNVINLTNITSAHAASTVAHGATGAVVGTTNTQTLTNKTIDAATNTISNLSHTTLTNIGTNTHSQIDTALATAANHIAATAAHGATGAVVGTTNTQTLTNKTIDAATNTISNLSHTVLTNIGTNTHSQIDTALATAATHFASTAAHGATGAVVGTTNTQTLTNKTINAANNTISNIDHTTLTNIGTNTHAQIDTALTNAANHIAATVAHGVTGAVVGTTNTQTLTNKTIDAAANTISNLSHTALTNIGTNTHVQIDTALATAATHFAATAAHGATGAVVGTTNTQTLTNKTISGAANTITGVDHTTLTNIGTNTHAQIDTALTNAANHAASTAAHGATGAVVGTTNTQTLTNKTIDAATNTISNLSHTALTNIGTNTHAQIDTQLTTAANHIAATAAHGVTGAVVGTTNSQTLTNKTIDATANTISNLSHTTLTNIGTNTHAQIDTALTNAATHIASTSAHGVTGLVVGTTDSQTLTNKTINAANNTLSNIDHTTLTNIGSNSHSAIDNFITWGYGVIDQSVKTTASPTFAAVTAPQVVTNVIGSNSAQIGFSNKGLFDVNQITVAGNAIASQFVFSAVPLADNTLTSVFVYDPTAKLLKTRLASTLRAVRSSARHTATTNQPITGGTPLVVKWPSFTDADITLDIPSGKFTINTAGYYVLQFAGVFAAITTGSRQSYLRIIEGSTTSLIAYSSVGTYPAGQTFISWSAYTHTFAAGATFEVFVTSAANNTLTSGDLYIEKSI